MTAIVVPVSLHFEASLAINTAAVSAAPKETGGLLLGWWDSDRIVVWNAIEVRDVAAAPNSWTRHEAAAQRALDQAVSAVEHPWIGYVGDWHSHPEARGASQQDLRSIREASRGYQQPILLIVHRSDGLLDGRAALGGALRTVSFTSLSEQHQ